nr:MAG TPA: hypothetical protein [Caudoviricetes sp.]
MWDLQTTNGLTSGHQFVRKLRNFHHQINDGIGNFNRRILHNQPPKEFLVLYLYFLENAIHHSLHQSLLVLELTITL